MIRLLDPRRLNGFGSSGRSEKLTPSMVSSVFSSLGPG